MKFLKFLSKNDYVILSVVVILAYWPITFCVASVKWDAINISIPWRFYIARSLQNFSLPLWYPNQNLGFAQYIDPQSWYWPSWLLSTFGYTNLTFHLEYVIHLVVAAMGVYHFSLYKNISRSSSLTVAIVYSLSGFFIGNAQHFGWIVSAAWTPIVILQYIKFTNTFSYKNLLGTSLSLFLLTTGGYWGFVISVYYFLVIFFLYRLYSLLTNKESKARVGLFIKRSLQLVILNVATTSIVLYSIVSNIDLIERGKLELVQLMYGSLYPVDFLSFFAPIATYVESFSFWKGDISLINVFIGTFSILVIVYTLIFNLKLFKEHWKLTLLIIFSFVLTMGDTMPLRRIFALYVPLFDYFRFPSLYRMFAIIGISLLLGHCIDQIRIWRLFSRFLLYAIGCYLIAIIAIVAIHFDNLRLYIAQLSLKPSEMPLEFLFILQFSISVGILLFYFLLNRIVLHNKSVLLKVFLLAEVIFVAQLMFPHTVVSIGQSPFAIFSTIKAIENNNQQLEKITLNEAEILCRKSYEYGLNKATYMGLISYWAYTPYQFKNYTALENDSLIECVKKQPFVYLSNDNQVIRPDCYKINATVESNRFHFIVDNMFDETVELNLSQNYHFGWHCFVNGERVNINRSKISLMQIELPSGRSDVEFVFKPDYIHILFVLSVLSFLFQLYFYIKN